MEKDQLSRKLAVILHADVVGSTSLVQKNETLAHERIQAAFHQFTETINSYGGITRELRGDALVAEFDRASDAVTASIVFQILNKESNATLDGDIQPQLRIGISLGEVIIADNTVTGAGVVLAQRLEQLADTGGIVVQGAISETVPTRMPFDFESLGEHELKGFELPVRAFSVSLKPGESAPAPESDVNNQNDTGLPNRPSKLHVSIEAGKPSIAVLPFKNMSGDAEQEYFSDGISEDIVTELSRFHDLFVIARHSSFSFKSQALDIADIGQKLGVQYLVEGSIRKSAGRVRITAQLIEVATGSHIWADRYDRELEDIFAVQDEVVRTITATLVGKVGLAHRDRAQSKLPSSMDAYDWFVQGRELYSTTTCNDNSKAILMFEKAVALDPGFAAAYALLAQTHLRDWITFWEEIPEQSYQRVWANARKSVELDDSDSVTQASLGYAYLFQGDHDQAYVHLNRALELNPGDTDALIFMSRFEMLTGRPELSIERINEANRYNPFGKYNWSLGTAYYAMRRYDEAKLKLQAIHSPAEIMLIWMAAVYAQAGEIEKAKNLATKFVVNVEEKLNSLNAPLPTSWLGFVAERWPFKHQADMDHLHEGLRKAGLPE
jgi:TolB-like protein/class 3 adenylate cyclase